MLGRNDAPSFIADADQAFVKGHFSRVSGHDHRLKGQHGIVALQRVAHHLQGLRIAFGHRKTYGIAKRVKGGINSACIQSSGLSALKLARLS